MYCKTDDLYRAINRDFLDSFLVERDDPTDRREALMVERKESAIKQASAEINGYLSSRYRVPLNPTPDTIVNVCIDIAIYKIICRRGINEDKPEGIWLKRYTHAIKFLEDVRDSKNDIGVEEGENINGTIGNKTTFVSPDAAFDGNFWRGFLKSK